ncbi:MAG: hypothetical protein FWF56_01690 [Firmicutes bacterium]|nr:hypothetical protein [Bacillota bacterium]
MYNVDENKEERVFLKSYTIYCILTVIAWFAWRFTHPTAIFTVVLITVLEIVVIFILIKRAKFLLSNKQYITTKFRFWFELILSIGTQVALIILVFMFNSHLFVPSMYQFPSDSFFVTTWIYVVFDMISIYMVGVTHKRVQTIISNKI